MPSIEIWIETPDENEAFVRAEYSFSPGLRAVFEPFSRFQEPDDEPELDINDDLHEVNERTGKPTGRVFSLASLSRREQEKIRENCFEDAAAPAGYDD